MALETLQCYIFSKKKIKLRNIFGFYLGKNFILHICVRKSVITAFKISLEASKK